MLARRHARTRAGFTLAEMMVVIVILGLLATLVVPNVLDKAAKARRAKAVADLSALQNALEEFAVNNANRFPESLEVLVQPDVNGSTYLRATVLPRDPWNGEYQYEPPGPGAPLARIATFGRDGQPGGTGEDADIDMARIRNGEVR